MGRYIKVKYYFLSTAKLKLNMIYEVQKFGVTLEWTDSLRDAEDAYKDAAFGGVVMYRIVGSNKTTMKRK